jgi:Uma2 family endonuclease
MTVQLLDSAIATNLNVKFKFTTQQYHLMHEAGVFKDGDRLELINGEIKTMSPIGRKHVACIIRLDKLIQKKLGDRVMVSTQNSIRLDDNSQPQPDLAILKPRDDFYESGLPTPSDILLIIEVADSSIDYDREVKAPLYSVAGIPEMWLFDVNKKAIEGYSQPSPLGYKQIHRYDEGDMLSMLTFPDVTFNWHELF